MLLLFLATASRSSFTQARPTADRLADLQVGVAISRGTTHYGFDQWLGFGAYANLDLPHHLGVAADFRQLNAGDSITYERTYELGGRYRRPVGKRLAPYAKGMVGRGVFNFAGVDVTTGRTATVANLAFNILSAGGGLDLLLKPGLNLRLLDYEYQRWAGFPPNGLHPQVLSFGAAYHFHGPMKLSR